MARLVCGAIAILIALTSGCATRSSVSPPLPPTMARDDMVALVQKADGSYGAVVVHQEDNAMLLDGKQTAARIRGPFTAEPATVSPEELRQTFGPALDALPPRPATFVLYFVEGKDELTPESKAAIAEVREELLRRPAPDITVTGHTDAIGTDRFNNQLSQLRAKRVNDELIRAGVRPAIITLVASGSREPLYPNAAGKAEPRNRRVEITAR